MSKQVYCLGFLIDPDNRQVVLIQKNKPNYQKGKYNGVGGKLEPEDESAYFAMTREFEEETRLRVISWHEFHTESQDDYTIHCFVANHKIGGDSVPKRVGEKEEQADWYHFEEVDSMKKCQMLVQDTYALYIKARHALAEILQRGASTEA